MKFLKLFLFTIVLISCTCLRLKFAKKNVNHMFQLIDYCCTYIQYYSSLKPGNIKLTSSIGDFSCDASQFIGMYCKCDGNCVYGTCKDGKCAWQGEGEFCYNHMQCSPYESLFCLNYRCFSFKGI